MDCIWPDESDNTESLRLVLDNLAAGCEIPPEGLRFSVGVQVVDKYGHPLDGDYDPLGKDGCNHRDSPEWRAHKTRKEHATMAEEKDAPPPMLAQVDGVATVATTESVGVDAAIEQVKALVPADTSPGLLIGGAALLAILGAGFRFGPQMLKARAERAQQAHELELERMRLEHEKSEKQDDKHKSCAAERAALEAKVMGLQARMDGLSNKAQDRTSLDLSSSTEEIEKRLAALEKKLSAARGRKKA